MQKVKFTIKFNTLAAQIARSERLAYAVHKYMAKDRSYDFDNIMSAIETSETTNSPLVFEKVLKGVEATLTNRVLDISKLPQFSGSVDAYIEKTKSSLAPFAQDEYTSDVVGRYVARLNVLRTPCPVSEFLNLAIISVKLVNHFVSQDLKPNDICQFINNVTSSVIAFGFSDDDLIGAKNVDEAAIEKFGAVVIGVWNELNPVLLQLLSLIKLYYQN